MQRCLQVTLHDLLVCHFAYGTNTWMTIRHPGFLKQQDILHCLEQGTKYRQRVLIVCLQLVAPSVAVVMDVPMLPNQPFNVRHNHATS